MVMCGKLILLPPFNVSFQTLVCMPVSSGRLSKLSKEGANLQGRHWQSVRSLKIYCENLGAQLCAAWGREARGTFIAQLGVGGLAAWLEQECSLERKKNST